MTQEFCWSGLTQARLEPGPTGATVQGPALSPLRICPERAKQNSARGDFIHKVTWAKPEVHCTVQQWNTTLLPTSSRWPNPCELTTQHAFEKLKKFAPLRKQKGRTKYTFGTSFYATPCGLEVVSNRLILLKRLKGHKGASPTFLFGFGCSIRTYDHAASWMSCEKVQGLARWKSPRICRLWHVVVHKDAGKRDTPQAYGWQHGDGRTCISGASFACIVVGYNLQCHNLEDRCLKRYITFVSICYMYVLRRTWFMNVITNIPLGPLFVQSINRYVRSHLLHAKQLSHLLRP